MDDSDSLDLAPSLVAPWPDDLPRPQVGLACDTAAHPWWTKYRRFLQDNYFPFRIVDIHHSRWIDEVRDLAFIVWRPSSEFHELEETRKKIFFMEQFLGIATYPTVRGVNLHEDKIVQSWALHLLNASTPSTVSSFDRDEAHTSVADLGPDIVWKLPSGAGSSGVERLSARQAQRAIDLAFSGRGRRTYLPYLKQKGYVYAQSLERELVVDMRVIVVGPLLFGYFRDPPRGDFRASGMGRVRKGPLPAKALEEAWQTAQALGVGALAVDFVTDVENTRWKIIELSGFIQVDTPEQLVIDSRPGVYVRIRSGHFVFREGRFWLQELALAQALFGAAHLDSNRLLLQTIGAT